jgi:hypothetical protein
MAVMCVWIDHNIVRDVSQEQVSEVTIYELSVKNRSVRATISRLTLILT